MGCIKFFNLLIRMFTQPRANQIMNKRKERVELQAGHSRPEPVLINTNLHIHSKRILIIS